MHDHAGSTVAFHTTMPFMGYEVVGSIEGHPVKIIFPLSWVSSSRRVGNGRTWV